MSIQVEKEKIEDTTVTEQPISTETVNDQHLESKDDAPVPKYWQKCWDYEGKIYYWNTETNETTYTLPFGDIAYSPISYDAYQVYQETPVEENTKPQESEFDRMKKLEQSRNMMINYYRKDINKPSKGVYDASYYEFLQHQYGEDGIASSVGLPDGYFGDSLTSQPGEAKTVAKAFTPEQRAVNQCKAYFDYEKFVEQRGTHRMACQAAGVSHKPYFTKKEIKKLHKAKKEKKAHWQKKWLFD